MQDRQRQAARTVASEGPSTRDSTRTVRIASEFAVCADRSHESQEDDGENTLQHPQRLCPEPTVRLGLHCHRKSLLRDLCVMRGILESIFQQPTEDLHVQLA